MKQELMKLIFPLVLLMAFTASAGEYTEKELPKELQFGSEMKAFHKRDFFKEVKDFSASVKSCRKIECTEAQETQLVNKMWNSLMTKINEMSWKCDYGADVYAVNAKGDAKVIKPLLKRMKFCEELNEKFQDFAYENCTDLLNRKRVVCEKLKDAFDENLRRTKNIKFLSSYN